MVARRVRQLRDRYGMSAARLAEEMTRAGVPWQREIVANLENGRRDRLDVGELLALAVVLNVPPLALLVPPEAETVPVTPEVHAHPADVLLWLLAEKPLFRESGSWSFEQVPAQLVRRWSDAVLQVRNARATLRVLDLRAARGRRPVSAEERAGSELRLRDGLQELRRVRIEMRGVGMTIQPPDDVVDEAIAAGLPLDDPDDGQAGDN